MPQPPNGTNLDPSRPASVVVGIVEQEGGVFKIVNCDPRQALAFLADLAEDLRVRLAVEALEGGGRRVEIVPALPRY